MVFNGKSLPEGIGVLGWTVSSPAVTLRSLELPGVRGRVRAGSGMGTRTVNVRVLLLGNGLAENIALLDALNAWCFSDGPAPLFLPGRTDRYLLAECTGHAHPEMAGADAEAELSFTCLVPEYFSAQERSCVSDGFADMGGSLSAPVRMECLVETKLQSPVWMIDAGVHLIHLRGSVLPGYISIDTERGVVTLDGVDISDQLTLDSDPAFMLSPGSHSFMFPVGVSGTVYWRERWL